MLYLGTIFPIAQIIVRNRSDGIQQGCANGLAVTLASTSGIVFVSDLFKDITGSTVYSEKSLSYKTIMISSFANCHRIRYCYSMSTSIQCYKSFVLLACMQYRFRIQFIIQLQDLFVCWCGSTKTDTAFILDNS